jgi:hypothetical protein
MIRSALFAPMLLPLLLAASPGWSSDCPALGERLVAASALSPQQQEGFELFFPHLCSFLEAEIPADAFGRLRGAETLDEFRTLLPQATGRDVFSLGETMLAHCDRRATPPELSLPMNIVESDHFVFVFPAGSPAADDIALIARTGEEIWTTIAELLGVVDELEASSRITATRVERGGGIAPSRHDGKIAVYLHAHRGGDAAARIPSYSYGVAQLGATILDGDEASRSGAPRLISRIDVLYLNPFSLVVLHHEIAHVVMGLGSFDARALDGRTVNGKGELRKAFFAGYRKVPVFLQEGVGDYAFYYRGFYPVWPLMVGSPEQIVTSLRHSGAYVPLATLLREGKRFRAANHKSYSLEAAAFIHFLETTRGPSKLRQWLFSGEQNGAKSFSRVYGSPLQTVELEWLAWLTSRAESHTAPAAGGSRGPIGVERHRQEDES